MAGPVGFVGREADLSRLLRALGETARMVLVVGDAGVGKTRFVAEGMDRAVAAGMVMARGECLRLADTLPLLPVVDALRELALLEGGRLLAGALQAAPEYVRYEIGRLLPEMGSPGETVSDGRDGEWRRDRLFAAVAELLATVARRPGPGVALVVEDVHWADSATLDCLTFLSRAGRREALTLVVTCRGDEAPVPAYVAGWLATVRATARMEEIRLDPLSWEEAAQQVAALTGGPVSARVAAELYMRAEGNPFFTEQLVVAALADEAGEGGGLRVPAGLPARLAELLAARAARCAGDARAVLAALAVAGRPLTEDQVGAVSGLSTGAVQEGLRELAAARLLAEDITDGAHRPRHALLTEAVAAGLLPGERAALHERTARALSGDPGLAAEAAAHWQAADRPAEELPARLAAAEVAERVFGYAQAAAHWQRAIELCQALPDARGAAGIDLADVYIRAINTLHLSGDSERAALVVEEAYRRFAGHEDPARAAVVLHLAAFCRAPEAAVGRLALMDEALRLFEQAPPSVEQADALLDYASVFLLNVEGRLEVSIATLNRALEIAEAAGATALIPRILSVAAFGALVRGQVGDGFAALDRGWALARATHDGVALLWLALNDSNARLKLARFQRAAEVALRGLATARQFGLGASSGAGNLAANAAEALLALGRTVQAAVLIDPLTSGSPDPDTWLVHRVRAEVDLLRGDVRAAVTRWQLISASSAIAGRTDFAYEAASWAAEAALWDRRPGDAIEEIRRALALFTVPDLTILSGRLLMVGMRAAADLAEGARARRDPPAAAAAMAAADGLVTWAAEMGGAPFTDHPFVAAIPAERATWDAERTRLAGPSDPRAWSAAVEAWQDLGCPHRVGYAGWRQAQALLEAGQPAAAAAGVLRAAAAAADGHAPLLARIGTLGERARIPLQPPEASTPPSPAHARAYGLTGRELTVLRLLAAGRTNAQIGAELYISGKTVGVHVSNILRKLEVSGRVQAAAVAERAGLLHSQQD